MNSEEYGIAANEVLYILKNMEESSIKKIPKSFINFLERIKSKNVDKSRLSEKIHGMKDVSEKAKELLGFIYVIWWSNAIEREQYKKLISTRKK